MTVNNVTLGVSADLRAATTRFFLPGAGEFASTLNLGQIIKGQVMRQYDGGNRYLVDFGGNERVVDSTVPLSTGELIHGRVVALGERVEVQRIYPRADDAPAASAPGERPAADGLGAFGRGGRTVEEFAARFRAQLTDADKAVLARVSRTASDPNAMALVGVMVNKLGLRQSPDLLWPVYRALLRENASSAALFNVQEVPQFTATTANDHDASAAAIRSLADAIVRQMDQNAPRKEPNDSPAAAVAPLDQATPSPLGVAGPKAVRNEQDDDADPRRLAHRLLNAQTGGAVAHRIGTVPLLLGDRLIEVDLAFFEQRREGAPAPQAQHRKVIFALATEHLGNVEISADVAGSHLRLQIASDDPEATGAIAAHVNDLRSALTSGQWQIDELVYETRQVDSHNRVVRSVVEHVVSQDSLNRLV